MAGTGEGRRGRRGRWLLVAVLLGGAAWIIRSRRAAAAADIGTGWPPPRPAGAGAEWRLPGADGGPQVPGRAANGNGAAPASGNGAAPVHAAAVAAPTRETRPAAVAPPVSGATPTAPTIRRPSPRPRTQAPAAPPQDSPQQDAPQQDTPPRGAASALPDGSAPGPEYTIKGNAGSMLFHTPASPYYGRTKAEYWFRTADDARAAGFTEWTSRRR